jgi:hypothetical protein
LFILNIGILGKFRQDTLFFPLTLPLCAWKQLGRLLRLQSVTGNIWGQTFFGEDFGITDNMRTFALRLPIGV